MSNVTELATSRPARQSRLQRLSVTFKETCAELTAAKASGDLYRIVMAEFRVSEQWVEMRDLYLASQRERRNADRD